MHPRRAVALAMGLLAACGSSPAALTDRPEAAAPAALDDAAPPAPAPESPPDAAAESPPPAASPDADADAAPVPAVVPRPARCPPGPFEAPAPGATTTLCADFKMAYNYNEGPTWIASENAFYFSNYQHYVGKGGDIIKYTPGGACEVFIAGVGCNGLAVTPDGNLAGACHQSRAVVRFDVKTKQSTVLADSYQGQPLNTPNDLVVHGNGTVYFTNPPFELGGRPAGVTIPIFRLDPAGLLTPVAQGRSANGIGLSPDEKRLYALQGGIWDLDERGVPSNQRALFVGGDGMAVDCAGNLYASGEIVSAQGKHLGGYPRSTNLTFGGADGKTLFLVGPGTRVRAVQMNVPGLP